MALSIAGSPALADLRRSTSAAHRTLEQRMPVMSDAFTLEDYGQLLLLLAALHQPLDEQVVDALHANVEVFDRLNAERRRKMQPLQHDLSTLGLAVPSPAADFDDVSSVAGSLGAMYVTEGASLGGRVIAPHLRRRFGADVPVSYFESYGPDVDEHWSVYQDVLAATVTSVDEIAMARAGALSVFGRFSQVLLDDAPTTTR